MAKVPKVGSLMAADPAYLAVVIDEMGDATRPPLYTPHEAVAAAGRAAAHGGHLTASERKLREIVMEAARGQAGGGEAGGGTGGVTGKRNTFYLSN